MNNERFQPETSRRRVEFRKSILVVDLDNGCISKGEIDGQVKPLKRLRRKQTMMRKDEWIPCMSLLLPTFPLKCINYCSNIFWFIQLLRYEHCKEVSENYWKSPPASDWVAKACNGALRAALVILERAYITSADSTDQGHERAFEGKWAENGVTRAATKLERN